MIGWLRHVLQLFIGVMLTTQATRAETTLSFLDRLYLEDQGGKATIAAIYYLPGSAESVSAALSPDRQAHFDETHTLIVRASPDKLLAAATNPGVRQIEIVADAAANRVAAILRALHTLNRQSEGMYRFGALNISLGVSRQLEGKHRSAEATIRRALSHFVRRTKVPVVMSIGNSGPVAGLVNPWALADGVVVATATDAAGQVLWPGSSRFRPGENGGRDIFAAHGYLSIGAYAAGSTKTEAMLDAEKQVDLTAVVGAGNERLYRVDSGTSYATAEVTRAICVIHQAVHMLRAQLSAIDALSFQLPPFIRAFIDTGVDVGHPLFANRLADRSPVYSGLRLKVTPQRRQILHRLALGSQPLRLDYDRAVVIAILKAAARPVPNTTADQTGHGFVSTQIVLDHLASWRMADLARIFGDPLMGEGHRAPAPHDAALPVFTEEEIGMISTYCASADLILMHKVD